MVHRRVYTSAYAGMLFTVLGVIAWVTGQPFIFPSLGPSAFVLAHDRQGEVVAPRRVVGSHLIGAVAGLVAYWTLAAGVTLTATPDPGTIAGLRLAAAGVCSVALTSWAMIATGTEHAPACATTLIVSLGLLSTATAATTIVVAVGILVAIHQIAIAGFEAAVSRLKA